MYTKKASCLLRKARSNPALNAFAWRRPVLALCVLTTLRHTVQVREMSSARAEACVGTAHSFTARMCAASRWEETQRPDSLFDEPQAYKLAGSEGRASPMGSWIMVPRTRRGDDYLRQFYEQRGVRQLVLLGAGFDARAYRMVGLDELKVFEVDQKTTFDVKEPLLADESLAVASRAIVATEFTERGRWAADLQAAGLNTSLPTVWLLEGLLMYLSLDDTRTMMEEIGALSAPGSAVFHDACSASYVSGGGGPVVGGAKFIGGSDDYGGLWATHAGFTDGYVRNFESVGLDRGRRRLVIDSNHPEASPTQCHGKRVVLFVTAEKV